MFRLISSRIGARLAFLCLAFGPGNAQAQAQAVEPQYSVTDLLGAFGCREGNIEGADGTCYPATRSFSLARPAAKQPAAKPRPKTRDLLITFANASAELTPQAQANARVFAEALNTRNLRGMRFAIEGHTSAVGSRTANLALSRRRAQALAARLIGEGVDADRLEVRGFGFDRPLIARNPRADGNRRVEARRLN